MGEKEEFAIILDYLPYGYPMSQKRLPTAQAIGEKTLALLELIPRRGITLSVKQKIYIGEGKREEIYYIAGRLQREKLTETAKIQLQEFVEKVVAEQEGKYVDFFNNANAINTRLHQIELLPGFGKKHTKEILEEREKNKFASFDEIKSRLSGIPDPRKAIEKRIMEELIERQRFALFVR